MEETVMPQQFPYPENNWATGKMRKVADVRRGRPELEEPGIAEAEKLAGAGIGARGGISSGINQQQKAQVQAFANQWAYGLVDWRRLNREVKDRGWNLIFDLDPTSGTRNMMDAAGLTVQEVAKKIIGKEKFEENVKKAREK